MVMNWKDAQELLSQMSIVYSQDNLRKLTYNVKIFPLALRYEVGERSEELYNTIIKMYGLLMEETAGLRMRAGRLEA